MAPAEAHVPDSLPADKTAAASGDSEQNKIVGGWRFSITFFITNIGLYAIFMGWGSLVLPAQVASISGDGKVLSLGIVTTIGAIIGAIFNPLFGTMSDQTQSRWGKRTPWLLVSGLLTAFMLTVMGFMQSFFLLVAAYIGVQLSITAFGAILLVTMPDRVPESKRGLMSSILGIATTVGALYGSNVAPLFIDQPWLANLIISSVLVVGIICMALFTKDPTAHDPGALKEKKEKEPFWTLFKGFKDHDLRWMFFTRFSIMLGYWMMVTYQFYTLTDYIGEKNIPGGNAATATGILLSTYSVASFVVIFWTGPLSDRVGRRKVFISISSLMIGIAAFIPVFLPTWNGMLAFNILSALGFGLYYGVEPALATLVLPDKEHYARDLGLLNFAMAGPQLGGAAVGSLVVTSLGGYPPLYIVGGVLSLASALLVWKIRRIH